MTSLLLMPHNQVVAANLFPCKEPKRSECPKNCGFADGPSGVLASPTVFVAVVREPWTGMGLSSDTHTCSHSIVFRQTHALLPKWHTRTSVVSLQMPNTFRSLLRI